mgnify:CR=1 FL=1
MYTLQQIKTPKQETQKINVKPTTVIPEGIAVQPGMGEKSIFLHLKVCFCFFLFFLLLCATSFLYFVHLFFQTFNSENMSNFI